MNEKTIYNIILYHNFKNKYYTVRARGGQQLENKINKIQEYNIKSAYKLPHLIIKSINIIE